MDIIDAVYRAFKDLPNCLVQQDDLRMIAWRRRPGNHRRLRFEGDRRPLRIDRRPGIDKMDRQLQGLVVQLNEAIAA